MSFTSPALKPNHSTELTMDNGQWIENCKFTQWLTFAFSVVILSSITASAQSNRLQLNENIGIGSYLFPGVARPLHINAYPATVIGSFVRDPTIRLSFGECPVTDCATSSRELSYGHLTFLKQMTYRE